MSALSNLACGLFSAACAFTLVSAGACGTDAKGVDDCRNIEQERCSAAKSCGIVSDVAECQRFYRDQCLHGLAVSSPGAAKVKACVDTIHAAGLCAVQGASTPLDQCQNAPISSSAPTATTACDIVTNPEKAEECSFLQPAADGGSGGAGGGGGKGGAGGTGGSSSGAAGQGGA